MNSEILKKLLNPTQDTLSLLVARSGTRFAEICCHFVPTIPAYQVPAAPKHPALDSTIFRGCCSKYIIKQFS